MLLSNPGQHEMIPFGGSKLPIFHNKNIAGGAFDYEPIPRKNGFEHLGFLGLLFCQHVGKKI